MGKIVPSNDRRFKGPWLLDRADFDELEKVISEIDTKLQTSLNIQMKDTARNENENIGEEELINEIENLKTKYMFSKKSKIFFLKIKTMLV